MADSKHLNNQLDLMAVSLHDPRQIWKRIVKRATLLGQAHLLVTELEFALVFLPQAIPLLLDPRVNAPAVEAHFDSELKAYKAQVEAIRSIKMQILEYLELYRMDTYLDIIQDAGGEEAIGPLTIPQITTALRAEIAGTNVQQRLKVKAELEAAQIDTTHDRPARHFRNTIREMVNLLREMGYVYAPSDLLAIAQKAWLVLLSYNNIAQMAYNAAHTNVHITSAILLDAMATAETTAINQGSRMVTQTAGAVYGANKAVTSATPVRQTTGMNTKQLEIMKRFEEAMQAAVKLADKHPDEVKLRSHFCPVHGFQDSHSGEACLKVKNL